MNPEQYFQINKLSSLHNGTSIFFCKTDYLEKDFKSIEKKKNFVILISGNSDFAIDKKIIKKAPKNIYKWYCQNAIEDNLKIEPIPIGLENKYDSLRNGHGVSYFDRMSEKEYLLSNKKKLDTANGKLYANFNILTNRQYRTKIKDVCVNIEYIDWDEPDLTIDEFYSRSIHYEAVICPAGNGIDTHRLWEMLYIGLVPITFKVGDHKIYELYNLLPIVILDSEHDLYKKEDLFNKIENAKNKRDNIELLDINYWKNKILLDSEIAEKIHFKNLSFTDKLKNIFLNLTD